MYTSNITHASPSAAGCPKTQPHEEIQNVGRASCVQYHLSLSVMCFLFNLEWKLIKKKTKNKNSDEENEPHSHIPSLWPHARAFIIINTVLRDKSAGLIRVWDVVFDSKDHRRRVIIGGHGRVDHVFPLRTPLGRFVQPAHPRRSTRNPSTDVLRTLHWHCLKNNIGSHLFPSKYCNIITQQ